MSLGKQGNGQSVSQLDTDEQVEMKSAKSTKKSDIAPIKNHEEKAALEDASEILQTTRAKHVSVCLTCFKFGNCEPGEIADFVFGHMCDNNEKNIDEIKQAIDILQTALLEATTKSAQAVATSLPTLKPPPPPPQPLKPLFGKIPPPPPPPQMQLFGKPALKSAPNNQLKLKKPEKTQKPSNFLDELKMKLLMRTEKCSLQTKPI